MAASCCKKLFYHRPVLVILGATGTGKSKLAIELAKRFQGEVINADAMQMYKGLDIATNKATPEEQDGIPHHLLGVWDPKYSIIVSDFRNAALTIIKDILDRNKLPIIVGGTCYYIESVLYKVLIDKVKDEEVLNKKGFSEDSEELLVPVKRAKLDIHEELVSQYEHLDNESLLERLREVDPESAETLHPNNRRKVLRCLEVYHKHNQTFSSLVKEQKSTPEGLLRFTNAVILWLQCETNVLNSRLYDRVDQMISKGLIQELIDFRDQFNSQCCSVANFLTTLLLNAQNTLDFNTIALLPTLAIFLTREDQAPRDPKYTKGVFQAIGYKEFDKYLMLDKEKRETDEGKKLLEEGSSQLKIVNRQYAKRQNKWIANRFLSKNYGETPPIYQLDVTDLSTWKENVYDVAEDIVESHLAGRKAKVEPVPATALDKQPEKVHKCEVCNRFLIGEKQLEQHMKSEKHKKVLKRIRKRKELDEGADNLPKKESNCQEVNCDTT